MHTVAIVSGALRDGIILVLATVVATGGFFGHELAWLLAGG